MYLINGVEVSKEERNGPGKDQRIGMIVSLHFLAIRVGDWIGTLGGGILYESISFEGSALVVFFLALIAILVATPIHLISIE